MQGGALQFGLRTSVRIACFGKFSHMLRKALLAAAASFGERRPISDAVRVMMALIVPNVRRLSRPYLQRHLMRTLRALIRNTIEAACDHEAGISRRNESR
jgi:hypothetical protein